MSGWKLPLWTKFASGRYRRASGILKRIRSVSSPKGCEIGVCTGKLSQVLLNDRSDLHLVMIDSWEGDGKAYTSKTGGGGESGMAGYSQSKQDELYRDSLAITEFASARREVLRMRSNEAVSRYPDRHFDFVFIDADHSYEGCKADLLDWAAKVKLGGWLCGHDYNNTRHPEFGVQRAVDEFCGERKLPIETGLNYTWFVKTI